MTNKQPNTETVLISMTEFRDFLFEPIVPLRELFDNKGKPLEKSFPYWRKNKLLPFIPKGTWAKLSFAQLIWVRVLDTLRSFSYTVANTQKVCDYFFKDAYEDGLPKKNLADNKKALEKKALAGTITEEEQSMLSWIKSILADKALLYTLSFDINYLSNLINSCLSSSEDSGILIFLDGGVLEYIGSELINHRGESFDIEAPHIRLSLRHFLSEFIDKEELSALVLPQLLNDNEKRVLKAIKERDVQEISIKIHDGNVIKIESTKGGVVTGKEAAAIKKVLGMNNYEGIELITRDNGSLTFKKTKKRII
ncbi:MAG: hypothetical protein WCG87_07525 [Bacteroidota bacterium]